MNSLLISLFLFSQKELVAGLHLCQINTSGCRLTLERGEMGDPAVATQRGIWELQLGDQLPPDVPAASGRNWKQYRQGGQYLGMFL